MKLMKKVLDAFSDEVKTEGTPDAAQAPPTPPPTVVVMSRRAATGDIDAVAYEEVQKGIEQRAPSETLSTFLAELVSAADDFPDERTRYKVALKTTAAAMRQTPEDILGELDRAFSDRLAAVVQERTLGEGELNKLQTTQLGASRARIDEIRQRVTDLRTEIGALQQEETQLTQKEAEVQASTSAALDKLSGACNRWTYVLQDGHAKLRQYLMEAAPARKEA